MEHVRSGVLTDVPERGEDVDAGEVPIVEFVAPMPGFPEARRFVLVRLDGTDLLYILVSTEAPGLRFLVMPPGQFFPGYAPEIDDESLAALGPQDPDGLLVLLVVTTGDTPGEASVNLKAPIVIAQDSRRAVQLILGGKDLPVNAPLRSG